MKDRLASLDGWRAISIGLVLVQHSYAQPGWPEILNWWPLKAIGGVGVRFFFVISGFLITYLMLREIQKTGRVSLKSFYVRRSLRILPVYFSFLFCVALVQGFGTLFIPWREWLYALTFTVNFGGANVPLGHLWTLGVEEQFYLLWPLVVGLFCLIRTQRLVICLMIPVLLCPMLRFAADHIVFTQPLIAALMKGHSFFTLCDGLAIGCLGAVGYFDAKPQVEKYLLRRPCVTYFTGCILIILPTAFWAIHSLKSLQFLQDTLQCSGFLLLLLHSILKPEWVPYRILNFRPVVYIGMLSYSLYLWHGLFDMAPNLWPFPMDWLHGFPNWLIGVFAAGILSYHFIEQPLLRKKGVLLQKLGLAR